MYDFSVSQHDIHDENLQLQYYRNFIVFLLGELKTLQDAMCASCRVKCASSPVTVSGSQSFSTPNDSRFESRRRRSEDDPPTLPRTAETDTFRRIPASSSNSMVEISTELSIKSIDRTFYAQKDESADTEINVEFVHSFCHEKLVSALCFSHDGRYLAMAIEEDFQGSIVMYEVESCTKYCELKEYTTQYGSHERPRIWSLCFSANGRYLAAGDYDYRVIIWDIPNKKIRSILYSSEYCSGLRFSPDGRLVAVCDMGLLVLNVRDNSRKMAYESCSSFDFSPNGRHIATGDNNGYLAILDVRTGKAVKRWRAHGTYLFCVKLTSNGKRLLSGYQGVIEHWDLKDAEPVLIKKFGIEGYLQDISPDNRLLACSTELWTVSSGKRQCTLEGHNDLIHRVRFRAAGSYLSIADWDGFVSLWKYTWT